MLLSWNNSFNWITIYIFSSIQDQRLFPGHYELNSFGLPFVWRLQIEKLHIKAAVYEEGSIPLPVWGVSREVMNVIFLTFDLFAITCVLILETQAIQC
jgi:hypothetical protein